MNRHPVDTAALRVIHRMKADANMALTEARKRESNGSGWERRFEAERRVKLLAEFIEAVETLADD